MNATLRSTTAAAALLLASIGAMTVAQPAAAQSAYGYARPAQLGQHEDRGNWNRDEMRHRRDDRGPVISDVTPSDGDRVGARGWTQISARFADYGSGVDMRFLVLRVDGRDVTHRSRVDGDDIRFADDLRPGRHVADLVVRDRAGNSTRRSWSFDVVGRGHQYGYNDVR